MFGFLAGILAMNMASAEVRIPGTQVSYNNQKDPMNDANMSIVFINELNDTGDNTYISLKCAAGDGWVFNIAIKYSLIPKADAEEAPVESFLDENYIVSYRVGSNPPGTIHKLSNAILNGKVRPESVVFFDKNANTSIAQGFLNGKKITIRIEPFKKTSLIKKALDYVFLPRGFAQAFKAIDYCR
jgi:hypothetical protein